VFLVSEGNARERARQFRVEVEQSKLAGTWRDPRAGRVTVETYGEQWRVNQPHRGDDDPDHLTSTAKVVKKSLGHLYARLGSTAIAQVRPSHIQAWVKWRSQAVAPSTLRTEMTWVRALFRAAVADHIITSSPCDGVRLPKVPDRSMVIPTPDDLEVIAGQLPAHWRALIYVGAETGLRPGELFGLCVEQVDFLRRTLKVDRQHDGAVLKTDASYRTIPLAQSTCDLLAAQLAEFGPGKGGQVFHTADGGQLGKWAQTATYEAALACGLKGFRLHDLRHYCASVMLHRGASIVEVQEQLGHESAVITMSTYAHLMPNSLDRRRAILEGCSRHDRAMTAPQAEPTGL
jgi:integrase